MTEIIRAQQKTRQKWGKRPDGARIPIGRDVIRTAWCEGCKKQSSDFGGVVSAGWLFKCAGRPAVSPHFFVAEPSGGE